MTRLGACSWSLQARTPHDLTEHVRAVGVNSVQLALDPLRTGHWGAAEAVAHFQEAGIELASGMMGTVAEDYTTLETIRTTGGVRPDAHWRANLENAGANARIARELGMKLVSFHAGFLPEEPGAERSKLIGRLREIADVFAHEDVAVAFETGQETADTLLVVLEELGRENVGVNFDPANMLLYDQGDPVEALRKLLPWVRQIHVKDAVRTRIAGEWGEEVPVGTGEVDWDAFFGVYRAGALSCDLMIEREAGSARVSDMQSAAALVRSQLPHLNKEAQA